MSNRVLWNLRKSSVKAHSSNRVKQNTNAESFQVKQDVVQLAKD